MKTYLVVFGAFAIGLITGFCALRLHRVSQLRASGLTTEEFLEGDRAAPVVVKELATADDKAAAQLAVMYGLMIAGDTEKTKERTREMLDEYYTRVASDEKTSDTRRAVVRRVGEVLGK